MVRATHEGRKQDTQAAREQGRKSVSCRVRDTESDLQAERLWLTLPSLEWWGGHRVFRASPGHREADPQEGDPSSGRWEL